MSNVIDLHTERANVFENGWLLRGDRVNGYSLSRGLDSVQCIDKLTPGDIASLAMMLSNYITSRGRR